MEKEHPEKVVKYIYIYIYIYIFHMPHTGERYDSVYMYIFFEKLAPVNFYLGGALV